LNIYLSVTKELGKNLNEITVARMKTTMSKRRNRDSFRSALHSMEGIVSRARLFSLFFLSPILPSGSFLFSPRASKGARSRHWPVLVHKTSPTACGNIIYLFWSTLFNILRMFAPKTLAIGRRPMASAPERIFSLFSIYYSPCID